MTAKLYIIVINIIIFIKFADNKTVTRQIVANNKCTYREEVNRLVQIEPSVTATGYIKQKA